MRRYETEIRRTEELVCVELLCDICGRKAASKHQSRYECDWAETGSAVAESEVSVTVRLRQGERFPECGSGDVYVIDICPECFHGKLIPWVETFGETIQPRTWETG